MRFRTASTVGAPWSSSTLPSLGRGRVAPPRPSDAMVLPLITKAPILQPSRNIIGNCVCHSFETCLLITLVSFHEWTIEIIVNKRSGSSANSMKLPWASLDILATLCGEDSFSQLPLLPDSFGFLGGTGPSPSYSLCSTLLPRSQPFFVLLPMQDKKEEVFMQRLRTPSAGSDSPPP